MDSVITNDLGNKTAREIKFVGQNDFPILLKETGNEDVKGMQVYDLNDTLRYRLTFAGGHLKFSSWNASGTVIVDNVTIV